MPHTGSFKSGITVLLAVMHCRHLVHHHLLLQQYLQHIHVLHHHAHRTTHSGFVLHVAFFHTFHHRHSVLVILRAVHHRHLLFITFHFCMHIFQHWHFMQHFG